MSVTQGRRTRTSRRTLAASALVVLATLLAGCSTSGDSSTGTKGYVTGDGAVTILGADDRPEAPEISGDLLGGGTLDLSTYAGKVIVLNAWGSWCGPCRGEAPDLVAASKELPDVRFVGLNSRDEEANAAAFVRRYDVPYPSLLDQDNNLLLLFHDMVSLASLPVTIVIDADDKVAAVVNGPISKATLVDLVEEIRDEA